MSIVKCARKKQTSKIPRLFDKYCYFKSSIEITLSHTILYGFSCVVSRLKELKETDDNTAKNILSIINAMLFSKKPTTQLSDTFLKRFDACDKYNKTEKRLREIEKELKDTSFCEHAEAFTVLNELDKSKKDIRWLTFLSAEYLDVIFDVYRQDLIEQKIEKRCKNGKENK